MYVNFFVTRKDNVTTEVRISICYFAASIPESRRLHANTEAATVHADYFSKLLYNYILFWRYLPIRFPHGHLPVHYATHQWADEACFTQIAFSTLKTRGVYSPVTTFSRRWLISIFLAPRLSFIVSLKDGVDGWSAKTRWTESTPVAFSPLWCCAISGFDSHRQTQLKALSLAVFVIDVKSFFLLRFCFIRKRQTNDELIK